MFLLLLCLSALFMLTGMFIQQTLQVYYARDVLGSADFQIVLTVLSMYGVGIAAVRPPPSGSASAATSPAAGPRSRGPSTPR